MSIKVISIKTNKWIVISLALAAIGLYGMVHVFLYGQEHSYGVTREIPWGLLIVGYALFVAASAGLTLISSLGFLWGFKQFNPLIKRALWLAIAMVIGGFYLLFWDLGGPFKLQILRFIRYFYPFHYTSPVWWMGLFLAIYTLLLLIEFYFLIKKHYKLAFIFGLLTFFLAIFSLGNLGSEFSYDITRYFWDGPFLPIDFIISALVTGSVFAIFIQYFSNHGNFKSNNTNMHTLASLSKILVLFLGIMVFFEIWKILTSVYGRPPMKYESTMMLINGVLAINFWVFEVIIGIIMPIVLLLISKFKSPKIILLSAFLVVIGLYVMRYDMVYAGQIVSVVSGYLPHVRYAVYHPSLSEISLFISALGVVGVIYFLGERFMNLSEGDFYD